MSTVNWISCQTEYQISRRLRLEEVQDHPLKASTISVIDGRYGVRKGGLRSTSTSTSTSTPTPTHTPLISQFNDPLSGPTSLDGTDPLSSFAKEELDPLSKMAVDEWDYSSSLASPGKKPKEVAEQLSEPWSIRKNGILNKYSTSDKLSITSSYLNAGEKVVKTQGNSLVDKVRHHLEQLDDFEEGSVRQMMDLSQQEYITRIKQLKSELVQAWLSDQRVKSLKIAIQCAKLLVDTSGIAFYPSKFVLITDILDKFGKLVYDRLKMKSDYYPAGSKECKSLPDNFTPEMVPESAKETCRNWFYKIASIRELVPRLYVEMAIIKSYSFLKICEFDNALLRITKMIRGIGNPLIAVYARCYLCRVGLTLNKPLNYYDFARENFYDYLLTHHQLFSKYIKNDLIKQDITMELYLNLYTPALDWILYVINTTNNTDNIIDDILIKCKQQNNNGLLLNAILSAFKSNLISSKSMEFIKLIEQCDQDIGEFPQYILYRNLGESIINESLSNDDCLKLWDIVWNYIINLKDPYEFMNCTEIWILFVVKHFSITILNNYLREIINHINDKHSYENYYNQLQNIIDKIISNTNDFDSLFTMDNFLPLIDLFHKESIKVDVCKNIIEKFLIKNSNTSITDPIIINTTMFIAKIMHDSVNALTVDDEKRQIGHLICGLIQRVDYGRDFEKQLNFYAEARSLFNNIDPIHIQLIQCVNRQAVDTRKIVKGHHTRRTAAFVRACAAYSFITIPSLTSVQIRLQLYLLSGQVALLNQCLGQADSCFKAALSLVPEMPKTIEIDGRPKNSEPFLLSYLSNFLSTLLVVPDSPEHGVLYLLRGLINAISRCFDENSSLKYTLYFRVLDLLSTITRETYPYQVDKVDSNDKLYGSDEKFIGEVDKICTKILDEILNHLKYLGSTSQYEKQSSLALDLFGRLIMRADLKQPSLTILAINLWNLSEKHGCADPKVRIRTVEYIKRKSQSHKFQHLREIVKKITK